MADGRLWALGAVALLSGAALVRKGSRSAEPIGQGRYDVNVGAAWRLMAQQLYGSHVDLPLLAVREALQNSRDALADNATDPAFSVSFDRATHELVLEDTGHGMSESVVFSKFVTLFETTKTKSGATAGGFGVAKASILALSQTFHWRLETVSGTYVSTGFDDPILRYAEPVFQGTRLVLSDVNPKYDSFWFMGTYIDYEDIHARLWRFLSMNDVSFPIFLNGHRVEPAYQGAGQPVGERLVWGEDVSASARIFEHGPGVTRTGYMVVRLGGLVQFVSTFDQGVAFDCVVDVTTTKGPRDQGYPFTLDRMKLQGQASDSLQRLYNKLNTDALSAVRGKVLDTLRIGDGSPGTIVKNRAVLDGLLSRMRQKAGALLGRVPAVRSALDRTDRAMRQEQKAYAQKQGASSPGSVRDTLPPTLQKAIDKAIEEAKKSPLDKVREQVEAQEQKPTAQRQQRAEAERKVKRQDNPFAGMGALRIQRDRFPAERLAIYLDHPDRLFPLLALWRMTNELVLEQMGQSWRSFVPGFILDDKVGAEYFREGGEEALMLNPDRFVRVLAELDDQPVLIAAWLHNKASHEIAHLIGYLTHDESFVAMREHIGDRTAMLIPPIAIMAEALLGLEAGPSRPKKKPVAVSKVRISSYDEGRLPYEAVDTVRKEVCRLLEREWGSVVEMKRWGEIVIDDASLGIERWLTLEIRIEAYEVQLRIAGLERGSLEEVIPMAEVQPKRGTEVPIARFIAARIAKWVAKKGLVLPIPGSEAEGGSLNQRAMPVVDVRGRRALLAEVQRRVGRR